LNSLHSLRMDYVDLFVTRFLSLSILVMLVRIVEKTAFHNQSPDSFLLVKHSLDINTCSSCFG